MRRILIAMIASLMALCVVDAKAQLTLSGEAPSSPTPAPAKPPTEITATDQTTFNQKTRIATFEGNVYVKDPNYTITCDRLTAVLKKEVLGAKDGAAPSPTPSKDADDQQGSRLERANAEGHVVITQDKIDSKTGKVQHYVGKGQKAVYEGDTGDITLTGWPQITQDDNTHVSLSESTVMIINRSGTIRTHGPSKTLLVQQPAATPAITPAFASPVITQ